MQSPGQICKSESIMKNLHFHQHIFNCYLPPLKPSVRLECIEEHKLPLVDIVITTELIANCMHPLPVQSASTRLGCSKILQCDPSSLIPGGQLNK